MKEFSWHTHEYVHREKTQDWFWALGIVAAAAAITSVIFGNILFAIVIVIGAFVIALFAARKPNVVSVEVNDKGVLIEKTLYPFKSLKSFWIDEDHRDGARLILVSQKVIMPYIMVPVAHDEIDMLRAFLETHLESEPFEESPFQVLLDRLGI
ncbi:MAG: hypothetical protein WC763_02860 [Candidatus Paceibacterota bacterium]|jgi:hypothetical protein